MKRLSSLLAFGLVLFYLVWPAYSGYAIKSALDAKDAGGLREWVDFDAVRSSMQPAVTAEVDTVLDAAAAKAGPTGASIYAALKTEIMPKIVDAALAQVVTPEALIRVHEEQGTIKEILNKHIGDQVSKAGGLGSLSGVLSGSGDGQSDAAEPPGIDVGKVLGGLLGKKDASVPVKTPATPSRPAKSSLSWQNIKGFGLEGLDRIYLHLAKDAAAPEPDLTAHMTFQNGGWVLTGLVPRFE